MNPLGLSSLVVAILSSPVTLFGAWLLRRDQTTRATTTDSTHLDEIDRRVRDLESTTVTQKEMEAAKILRVEIERRVHTLETDGVSQRDFDGLSRRLDDIKTDLREIRNSLESARNSAARQS